MSRFGRLFERFRPADGAAEPPHVPDDSVRWVVAGLGNPGEEYRRSRHNLGFMVIDRLAAARGIDLARRKFNGLYGEGRTDGVILMLVTPQTYYNRSGACLAGLLGYFKVPIERLIVVHDEMDLPTGQLRIKCGGSDAGNRGVRSIAAALGPDFIRVRVGVDHPADSAGGIDHVLQPFDRDELRELEPALQRAGDAAMAIIRDGLERAMNQYNQRA